MLISQQKITPLIKDLFPFRTSEGREILNCYIPHRYKYWVGSGREALRQALSQIGGKRVGVPAYTCQVVLDAVKRAGKEPIFYDSGVIAQVNEIKKIIKQIDIILICHNFGFMPEMDKISELCRKHKVILIEDCAQALGATYDEKLAGTFGDYTFYSFGMSKNIGFCGGMVAGNKELKINKIKKFPKKRLLKIIFEVLFSPIFFNKYFYHFTYFLLREELHKTPEALNYACPNLAKIVILKQFRRYGNILRKRTRNATYCIEQLKNIKIINFVYPLEKCNPSWLYFILLVDEPEVFQKKIRENNIDFGKMLTFRSLDGSSKKSLEAEKKVLTFALFHDFKEIKYIVENIKEVAKDGNY